MLISIDKGFDKRDDEPWDEYIERKLSGLAGFINDSSEFFDFREVFNDRDGAEVGHEFTLILAYDAGDNVTSIRSYCRAVEFLTPGDDQTGEDYSGENLDEIKARFLSFSEKINTELGLTFSFDSLIKKDLFGLSEELLDMTEFRARLESDRLNKAVRETNNKLKEGAGLSL